MASGNVGASLRAATALTGVVLSCVAAQAGGFALREQSAYFQGTSFAGAAAGGPAISSMFWNPATMTQAPLGLSTDMSATGVFGRSTVTPLAATNAAFPGLLGLGGSGDIAQDALVPASYGVFRLNESWAFGVAMNAPFGLATNPPPGWAGMFYALDSKVFSLNVTPQLAYKVNDWLSVGVGLQGQYTKVTLDSAFPGSGIPGVFANPLSLRADSFDLGFTVGITLTPTPWTTIGIGYRSAINQGLDGTVTRPAFALPGPGGPILVPAAISAAQANVRLPDTVSVGIRQKVSEAFTLLGTFEWANWSRLGTVGVTTHSPAPGLPTALPFEWENGWFGSVGGEYQWNERWAMRAGVGFERSPIRDTERTPRLPDNDRVWVSAGLSYVWSERLTFDIGYSHIFVKDAPINIVPGHATFSPALGTFIGTAQSEVDIVSVGMRFKLNPPAPAIVTKG